MKKKTIALVLACILCVAIGIGGTLAWLTANAGSLVNTFTATDIEVTLKETFNVDSDNDGTKDKWQAQMVPGVSYTKDPVVTVTDKTTVDCYLFVKFEESTDAKTYLTYTSTLTTANGWKQVPGQTDVWYREVKTTDAVKSWHLLDGDTVTVNGENVTKDNMSTAAATTLTYTAYAAQLMKDNTSAFEPEEAWAKVAPASSTP